jgi:ribulose-phosphate 3-epimerase
MEIIPAILPKDFYEIEEKTAAIVGLADIVQIDICDGKFVPSTTWPYKRQDENFEAIIREERGMPEWEELDFEFDLMVKDPTEDEARKWLSAGAKRVVLHVESSPDLTPVLNVLSGLAEVGLALNIQTPLDVIEKYKDKISYLQFMGITKVGFQGQAFDTRVLEKIKKAKETYPNLAIQVDGGVSLATAGDLAEAGADRLVAGSVLFGSDNIVDTYHQLARI